MSIPGLEVQSAEEFVNVARQSCKNIEVILVKTEEIEGSKTFLRDRFKDLKSFDGIRSFHSFKVLPNYRNEGSTTSDGNGKKIWDIYKKKKNIIKENKTMF